MCFLNLGSVLGLMGSGEEAAAVMDAIRAAAVATSGLDPERVTCGQDFDVIPVR